MATLIGTAAGHFTTRARRRALVVGFYLAFAASVALHMTSGPGSLVLLASAMFTAIFTGRLLLHLIRSPAPDDERMRRVREQAYHQAYRIFTYLILAAMSCVLVVFVTGGRWVPYTPHTASQWMDFLQVVCWIVITLPFALMVWTEPDLPVDTLEEREAQRAVLQGPPFPRKRQRFMVGILVALGLLTVAQFAGVVHLSDFAGDIILATAAGLGAGGAMIWNWGRGPKR